MLDKYACSCATCKLNVRTDGRTDGRTKKVQNFLYASQMTKKKNKSNICLLPIGDGFFSLSCVFVCTLIGSSVFGAHECLYNVLVKKYKSIFMVTC